MREGGKEGAQGCQLVPQAMSHLLGGSPRSRLFLEDDPPTTVEDDPPTSVEYDASTPSVTRWKPSASAVFVFLFLLLAGTGGTLAWRYYVGQAMDMTQSPALPGATNKPTSPPKVLQSSSSSLNP